MSVDIVSQGIQRNYCGFFVTCHSDMALMNSSVSLERKAQ